MSRSLQKRKISKSKNNILENVPSPHCSHALVLPSPGTDSSSLVRYAPFSFPLAILCSYQASKAFLILLRSTVTSPSKLATFLTHQNNLETLYPHCFWHFTCQCYQYRRESSVAQSALWNHLQLTQPPPPVRMKGQNVIQEESKQGFGNIERLRFPLPFTCFGKEAR